MKLKAFLSVFWVLFLFRGGLSERIRAQSVRLDEVTLKSYLNRSNPTSNQIEASFLQTQYDQSSMDDRLSWILTADANLVKSEERLLSNNDAGVMSRNSSYSVGVVKPTKYGLDVGLSYQASKNSNAFLKGGSTSALSLQLSFDLYQNFLGKKTRQALQNSRISVEVAELEKKISLKSFHTNIKKLYWNLVANREKEKLVGSLEKLAEKQLKEAKKRLKSGVADSGEVAKYSSQLSLRRANLLSLQNQKNKIIRSFKELVPELIHGDILLGAYDIESTRQEVLQCTQTIAAYLQPPVELSPYSDLIALLRQQEKIGLDLADRYASADIKLVGEYARVGRGFGYSKSQDDFVDHSKPRTTVGLQFSMPLGSKKSNTEEISKKIIHIRTTSKIQESWAKIQAYHSETLRTIAVLNKVMMEQKNTNKYLDRSLEYSRKKYRQARINVQELINEQDSLFQAKLSEIDTNLSIVNTLLDYFSVYTEIPCRLNKA